MSLGFIESHSVSANWSFGTLSADRTYSLSVNAHARTDQYLGFHSYQLFCHGDMGLVYDGVDRCILYDVEKCTAPEKSFPLLKKDKRWSCTSACRMTKFGQVTWGNTRTWLKKTGYHSLQFWEMDRDIFLWVKDDLDISSLVISTETIICNSCARFGSKNKWIKTEWPTDNENVQSFYYYCIWSWSIKSFDLLSEQSRSSVTYAK